MIVDSSAVMAVLLDEPERAEFQQAMAECDQSYISAVSVLETGVGLRRKLGESGMLLFAEFLEAAEIVIVPFDGDQVAIALQADADYGKGLQKPGKLNFGDCASYALAKATGLPLLFKGDDFPQTDIEVAV